MSWPQVPIVEVAEIVSGATPSTSTPAFWGGEIAWVTPKDVSDLNGRKFLDGTPRTLTVEGLRACSADVLPPNSVLFSSRAPIGLVAINSIPVATNQGFKSFVPNSELLDTGYLYHWLRMNRPALERLGVGATFKEVSKAIVSKVKIPLPPLAEQRRIAALLDKAEELRAKRRAALALLDQLPQAIFLEMFGDPETMEIRYKSHPVSTLLAEPLRSGAYYPRNAYTLDGGVEMVHMSDAFYGVVRRGALKRVLATCSEISKYALEPTDLLIARRSLNYDGAAKACRIPQSEEPLLFESSLIRLRLNQNLVNTEFMFRFINHPQVRRRVIEPLITRATISGINQSNFGSVRVAVPPLNLQRQFAARVDASHRAKAAHQSSLDRLGALCASMQFDLLGTPRLRGAI